MLTRSARELAICSATLFVADFDPELRADAIEQQACVHVPLGARAQLLPRFVFVRRAGQLKTRLASSSLKSRRRSSMRPFTSDCGRSSGAAGRAAD
jgi:hypothetical protein